MTTCDGILGLTGAEFLVGHAIINFLERKQAALDIEESEWNHFDKN